MSLLERFKRVSGEELGLRSGLALVELPNTDALDEVKVGDGKSLFIAKPETHKLSREEKKAFFVTVLAVVDGDGLEPGNIVHVSKESITTFSVYGDLADVKEEQIGLIQVSGVMQYFQEQAEYDAVFKRLNEA